MTIAKHTCNAGEQTGAKAIPASVEPSLSFPAVVVSKSLRVEPCSVLLATSETALHCCRTSRLSPLFSSFKLLASSTDSLFSVEDGNFMMGQNYYLVITLKKNKMRIQP